MHIKGIKKLGLITMICCLPATISSAQTVKDSVTTPTTPSKDSTTRKTKQLAPVVVRDNKSYATKQTRSATKTNTLLRDIPQSITTVTKELIKDQSMQGMSDVVRYVPGITMAQGEGHRDAPTIRGNSTTANFYVDGVRDDIQYFRDLYNSDRIEALKGASALTFGRGAGGGVINRVTKQAEWNPVRELTVQGGSYGNRRTTLDVGQGLSANVAVRLNSMYESSSLFRNGVTLDRYGINPTATFRAGDRTTLKIGYEYFNDHRVVDRGVPSNPVTHRPVDVDISTFFGNQIVNHAQALVNNGNVTFEHTTLGGLNIRNNMRYAGYDKFYQNLVPGGVNTTANTDTITGYNHATQRKNFFNQTDLTYDLMTGSVKNTLLFGMEAGRQITDDFRNNAYFNGNTSTFAITRPLSDPSVTSPVAFGQFGASLSDNHSTTNVASVYLQNQVTLTPRWQAVAGVRLERFNLNFNNHRTNQVFKRDDRLLSPRAGLIFKPVDEMSFYTSYSISHLPSSGDQFSSLTATTDDFEPEEFKNYEVGAKWDVLPDFSVTAAAYRLLRNHSAAPDPNNPAITIQTGAQETKGYELGISGNLTSAWQISTGFVTQRARITKPTTSSPTAGKEVALVPHNTLSVWNKYNFMPKFGAGLGVVSQARMFAAVDNKIILPGFTRVDGALYYTVTRNAKLQANVENIFDRKYYPTAQGNNNILPGAPRTLRVSITTGL